jgi:hypothetical protein
MSPVLTPSLFSQSPTRTHARRSRTRRRGDPLAQLDFTAWDELVDREVLIDLAEWAEARGCEPLAHHRCAVTGDLWTQLERIPFRQMGRTSLDERVRALHRCASRALKRALLDLPSRRLPLRIGLDFAAPIVCSPGRSASILRLHAVVTFGAPIALVIDLPRANRAPGARPTCQVAESASLAAFHQLLRGARRPSMTAPRLVDRSPTVGHVR